MMRVVETDPRIAARNRELAARVLVVGAFAFAVGLVVAVTFGSIGWWLVVLGAAAAAAARLSDRTSGGRL